jgi:circadian clock protein KaiC
MHHTVETFDPDVVVVDPITNLMAVGSDSHVRSMLTRLIDFLKTRGVTAMFASLTSSGGEADTTETLISSLMDTWMMVATDTVADRRTRKLHILKSRGMPHSDEVRTFNFTSHGIELLPLAAPRPPSRKAPRRRAARGRK